MRPTPALRMQVTRILRANHLDPKNGVYVLSASMRLSLRIAPRSCLLTVRQLFRQLGRVWYVKKRTNIAPRPTPSSPRRPNSFQDHKHRNELLHTPSRPMRRDLLLVHLELRSSTHSGEPRNRFCTGFLRYFWDTLRCPGLQSGMHTKEKKLQLADLDQKRIPELEARSDRS